MKTKQLRNDRERISIRIPNLTADPKCSHVLFPVGKQGIQQYRSMSLQFSNGSITEKVVTKTFHERALKH